MAKQVRAEGGLSSVEICSARVGAGAELNTARPPPPPAVETLCGALEADVRAAAQGCWQLRERTVQVRCAESV